MRLNRVESVCVVFVCFVYRRKYSSKLLMVKEIKFFLYILADVEKICNIFK